MQDEGLCSDAAQTPAEDPIAGRRDADFSRAVLEDLYRYPPKSKTVAYVLLALTGPLGGHRFYLDRPATALAMALTVGGFLIGWLVDIFRVPVLLREFNEDQAERQRSGQPPRALSFMPPLRGMALPPQPEWVHRRGGRRRLLIDVLALCLGGFAVGVLTSATGNYEAVLVIVALSAIILLGARWDALAKAPLLRNFDRWSHRLRLYYYVNDPGGPATVFFRPVFGLITAPFRKRARAEAWLYLQMGLWFTVIFTGLDILDAIEIGAGGVNVHPLDFLADVVLTLVSIYAFAAPIGAILTTHVLLERRDRTVWMLTGVALLGVFLGLQTAA